jgi:HlyD family secretion protein
MIFLKRTSIVLLAILLTSCGYFHKETWQGYVEGQFTAISPNFSGILNTLYVERGTPVHQGDPLFILEQEPEDSLYLQAKANVEQAQQAITQNTAAVELAQKTYQRNTQLFKKKLLAQAELDTSTARLKENKAALEQAKAHLTSVEASLTQATWQKNKKTIYAPKEAMVFDKYYLPGELVQAGRPVLSLLAPQDIEVTFFVDTVASNNLKIGQTVHIQCDGCKKLLTGKIVFISPQAEYTPPVIYSNDTKTKFIFRIKAKTALNEAFKLHPGEPVSVTL